MFSQPIQSSLAVLRGSWRKLRPRFSGKNFNRALLPVFAAAPYPAELIEGAPITGESVLIAVLAGLAGILGISAGLLYRHMHRAEECTRSRAQNAEAELRALLLMTDEAVLVLDPDGTVRTANPAAEEIFDRPLDQFSGMPLTDLIAQPLCLTELTKHGPVNFETMARRSGGEFPKVEMLLSPVEFGGRTSYVALVHDSKAAAQPGEGTKPALPDLAKPVGKFTHDLNNELTTIIGNLSLILMSTPSDPANHERIVSAKRTAVRAHSLSQKLQALAAGDEIETGTPDSAPATAPTIVRMPPPSASPAIPPNKSAAPHKPRILILDDEEAICALLATALNAMGFDVTEATSVRLALGACESALNEGKPFDLVISDLSLPGDMSGKEAVARIHAIDPRVKAIVSSGYDADPVMSDCRNHGFDAAIAKPYDIGKLARTVREVLATRDEAIRKSA